MWCQKGRAVLRSVKIKRTITRTDRDSIASNIVLLSVIGVQVRRHLSCSPIVPRRLPGWLALKAQ